MHNRSRLWAPWRSEFTSHAPTRSCIFCVAKRSRSDKKHHVIARDAHVFAILNRYPYNNGHFMVAPYRHVGRLESITLLEWEGMLRLSQRLIAFLRRKLRPHGFNIGFNIGKVGGAGIPGHLHLHVVPRWNGDTNFMPVIAETKVISQSLDELYSVIRASLGVADELI